MSSKRLSHLGLCGLISLVLTVAAVALDSQRAGVQQTRAGLLWARQVASQAEGMVLKARENGEKDPLEWVVNYLSQGVEPRLIRVTRAHMLDSAAQSGETYKFDRPAGVFEYTRIFTPEDGVGVHVQLILGYLGFLGAHSVLASDFITTLFFTLCFVIALLRTGRYFGFDDTQRIRARVSLWVGGAKSLLTQHGVHIREMVRQSQRLAACSGRSRELVGELRSKIHGGLTELHESREFYKEGETIAARAETLALNMAIEANRLGGDARRIADMATELHRRIQALHSVNRKGQSLIQRLERKIEPWSTDADLTFHAFDDVKDATDLLTRHIRGTTESLMGQAKLIQSLNKELGQETGQVAVLPAPKVAQTQPAPAAAEPAPVPRLNAHQAHQLPEPLPPIEDGEPKPLFRRIRAKKSA